MKLKQINPEVCKLLRADIDKALAEVGERYGLKITSGRGNYTATTFKFGVEAAVIAEDGLVQTREVSNFHKYATEFGLKPEDFGREVTFKGVVFTIVGLNTRAPAKPIMLKRVSDGREGFKIAAEAVVRALAAK